VVALVLIFTSQLEFYLLYFILWTTLLNGLYELLHRSISISFESFVDFSEIGYKSEDTPRKLSTATQPHFPRKIADFQQATGFQIRRRILRKLTFD
jgi:hypothetical protein